MNARQLGWRMQRFFRELCSHAGREGVIGFVEADKVRLLPEQTSYLTGRLGTLRLEDLTAVSLGLLYRESEILAVPGRWQGRALTKDSWNQYARAYQELNRLLRAFAGALVERFGGVAEQPTVQGWVGQVGHVSDYLSHCISHRAFAEAARLGWRGRHGLLVTPEAGPALRLATCFVPGLIAPVERDLHGCGTCRVCVEVCPILHQGEEYPESCRRRIQALGLEDDVCGICVRVCWEQVAQRGSQWRATP